MSRDKHICDFVFDPETWEGTYREWDDTRLVYETTAHLTDIPALLAMSGFGEADEPPTQLRSVGDA